MGTSSIKGYKTYTWDGKKRKKIEFSLQSYLSSFSQANIIFNTYSFSATFTYKTQHPTSNGSCLSQGVEMSPGKWNRKIFIDLQLYHVSTINQRTTSGFFKFEWFFGLWTNSIRLVLFRFEGKKTYFIDGNMAEKSHTYRLMKSGFIL